jgi:hypothetical protein
LLIKRPAVEILVWFGGYKQMSFNEFESVAVIDTADGKRTSMVRRVSLRNRLIRPTVATGSPMLPPERRTSRRQFLELLKGTRNFVKHI